MSESVSGLGSAAEDLEPRSASWPSGEPCSVEELRSLFLFERLTDEQLLCLCERGAVIEFEPGVVFREDEPAKYFLVLLEGEVMLRIRTGDVDVELIRSTQRGSYMGAVASFVSKGPPKGYPTTMRAMQRSRFFCLRAEDFANLMQDWFPMAVHLMEGLYVAQRNLANLTAQRERLLSLGSLTAGLTHELNNPAAAAVRATATLRERASAMRHKLALIASGPYDRANLESLIRLQSEALECLDKATKRPLSALEFSDREDEVADWLDDRGIGDAWAQTATFVQSGVDTEFLDMVASKLDVSVLEGGLRWLNYTLETELLLHEIEDAVGRISTLVGAAKQYSQLDRAPNQVLNIHDLLDGTLVMLKPKFGPGITLVKDYDRDLPSVPGYGAELNQVWTNLIDNAVSAMGGGHGREGSGTLTVRTAGEPSGREPETLLVEIGDTGPGIPAEIRNRIFEPFFTTKPVGEGTGLGLDISYRIVVKRHHGDLRVISEPGNTRFQVRLPLTDGLIDHEEQA